MQEGRGIGCPALYYTTDGRRLLHTWLALPNPTFYPYFRTTRTERLIAPYWSQTQFLDPIHTGKKRAIFLGIMEYLLPALDMRYEICSSPVHKIELGSGRR